MNKICTFTGHGDISYPKEIKELILKKCEELILNCDVTEFLVGNYGAFDKMSAGIVREIKKIYPFIKLTLVIPYLTSEINKYREIYYSEYDCIIIADMPENTPAKFKITKCNQYMIKKSDYLIAYVLHSFGGAAKTLNYAEHQKNPIIFNIGAEL